MNEHVSYGDSRNRLLIIGAPRSGTTLLRRLLNGHPDISCPPETYVFTAAARFLTSQRITGGGTLGVVPGLADIGFKADEVHRRLRELTFGFLQEYASQQGTTRWAEKTAVNAFHLENIEELCGDDVTYVCIVRHGLDVACSMKDLADRSEAYLSEVHHYVQQHARPLEAFCHAWVDTCRGIRKLVEQRPQNVVTLRYEDLVQDPNVEMTRIMAFVDAEWDANWIEEALQKSEDAGLGDWKTYRQATVSSQNTGRWKSLSTTTQSELAEIVNSALEEWDYEPVHVVEAKSETEAQRRYSLAVRLSALRDAQES